jgi:hypothetical protein
MTKDATPLATILVVVPHCVQVKVGAGNLGQLQDQALARLLRQQLQGQDLALERLLRQLLPQLQVRQGGGMRPEVVTFCLQ